MLKPYIFWPIFGEVSGSNLGQYTYYAEFSCGFPHPVHENCGIVPQITPLSFFLDTVASMEHLVVFYWLAPSRLHKQHLDPYLPAFVITFFWSHNLCIIFNTRLKYTPSKLSLKVNHQGLENRVILLNIRDTDCPG